MIKHTDTPIKAYKVTDGYMQCRGFQFVIGETYEATSTPIRCGNSGFHACLIAADCFGYYDFTPTNRVFEVEFWGDYDTDACDTKIASQYIRLLRELTWREVLDIVNTGKNNTGHGNSGHRNSGDGNSGDRNSGDRNSGYKNSGGRNSGDSNSGNGNSGYKNSGDGNSGNWNSGHWNSGYGNSGDFNACDYSSGFFNSQEQDVIMFNKPTRLKRNEIDVPHIDLALTTWVDYTQAEKDTDPDKALIGGYLKTYSYKEAWANWYKTADSKTIAKIKDLPNYDPDVFMEITGLDWRNK